MPNVIQLWLELIGTPERAQRLLRAWEGDPAEVLLGKRQAELAYAHPAYRHALDSWDTKLITRRDLVLWAKHVASGQYHGTTMLHLRSPQVTIEVDDWVMLPEQTQQRLAHRYASTPHAASPVESSPT